MLLLHPSSCCDIFSNRRRFLTRRLSRIDLQREETASGCRLVMSQIAPLEEAFFYQHSSTQLCRAYRASPDGESENTIREEKVTCLLATPRVRSFCGGCPRILCRPEASEGRPQNGLEIIDRNAE